MQNYPRPSAQFMTAKANGWKKLADGSVGHFVNGLLHREGGAALIRRDGKGEHWRYGKATGYVEDDSDISA